MKKCSDKNCVHKGMVQRTGVDGNFYRDRTTIDGYSGACKDCERNRSNKHNRIAKKNKEEFFKTFIG